MAAAFRTSLVALMILGQGARAQEPPAPAPLPAGPSLVIRTIEITGGSVDDHAYSRAALGLKEGADVHEGQFRLGLAAIRATDRFKTVEGRLEETPDGVVAHIQVDPWPELKKREIRGFVPKEVRDGLFPGLHKGGRAGELRLQSLQRHAEDRLKEAGYAHATVRARREDDGAKLVIEVNAGEPTRVRTLECLGDTATYSPERLKGIADIRPGKTIWTAQAEREALSRLRKRLVKDERFEGIAAFRWDPATGHLTLTMTPGPKVRLRQEGEWSLLWDDYKDLLPFARAGSYSPELLDEGDRRILRYLRDKGYLDAKVGHRREVLSGPPDKPDVVAITYRVDPGPRVRIAGLRFERNKDIPEEELQEVAALPSGLLTLGDPPATPDLISAIEDRVKGHYWRKGYPDVALRRPPLDRANGVATLVFEVREGSRQTLSKVVLEVPDDPSWEPDKLAEALPLIFTTRLRSDPSPDGKTLIYRSDWASMEGVTGLVESSTDPAKPGIRTYTFTASQPLPYVKNDLALVFAALRQKMASVGVQRPLPKLRLEQAATGNIVHLQVPDQPRSFVERVVVQGADYTRAKAVLRETPLEQGAPLDPDALSRAQTNLGSLGAFQRIDVSSLKEMPAEAGALPWTDGDLLLRTDERPPWTLSSAFGYDKSHGYHIGLGAQRANFLGMGRTLDFGARMGDGTLDNPTLRKWFPTGDFNRSVDSFTASYTDPWFLPGALKDLIGSRVQYRLEGAYIEETQAAFLAHRRRVMNTFDWKVGDHQTLRLGHRFERTDIKANAEGIELDELFTMAGVPGSSTVISAPFFQFIRDRRDSPIDPKRGTYFSGRLELANQLFGTGSKYSFAKLDLRHQWNWSIGPQAEGGVIMAAARIGLARPTASSVEDLPLSERFFAGGPYTVRGVEPDFLGPVGTLGVYDNQGGTTVRTGSRMIPLGGQGLVVLNLEYRFPLFGSQTVWGEVFADSGQVYAKLNPDKRQEGDSAPFPALRTTLGLGLILKLGFPIKFEYAADLKRILGKPRTQQEKDTQLKGLLVSAGYQY